MSAFVFNSSLIFTIHLRISFGHIQTLGSMLDNAASMFLPLVVCQCMCRVMRVVIEVYVCFHKVILV